MSNLPLISIIVPTCKRADMLERAIDSILNQTYSNIEIVVVNDNVPDSEFDLKTKATLQKYDKDNRVNCVSTTGLTGGGAARNLAIKHTNGEYVAFLDDDDRYLPDQRKLEFVRN